MEINCYDDVYVQNDWTDDLPVMKTEDGNQLPQQVVGVCFHVCVVCVKKEERKRGKIKKA